ncbi:MAG: efflux RND transporter periplasmic adaptor subunit [Halarsenatibacteraceae bacterium]
MSKKKVGIIFLIFLIISIGFLIYRNRIGGGMNNPTHLDVETITVSRGDINRTITASGTLAPVRDRNQSFSQGGTVETVFVEIGDRVSAGDNLIKLKSSQQELNLIQARNAYQSARINGTESEINERRTQLEIAEENLEERTMKADISGEIVQLELEAGDEASPGGSVVRILDETSYLVDLNIDEGDSRLVEPGQTAKIEISAIPDKIYEGAVTQVKRVTEVVNNVVVVPAEVKINNSSSDFRPGYSADVEIVVESVEDSIRIPVTAIFTEEGQDYAVIIDDEGMAESIPVETGLSDGLHVEIISGLEDNDRILVNAYQYSQRAGRDDSLDVQFGPPGGNE